MRSKMERVYVPYYCENCGKVEFEGEVFGIHRTRHLQAESGTRKMLCDHCRPKPTKLDLPEWLLKPIEWPDEKEEEECPSLPEPPVSERRSAQSASRQTP